jgi:hypothetical protein
MKAIRTASTAGATEGLSHGLGYDVRAVLQASERDGGGDV